MLITIYSRVRFSQNRSRGGRKDSSEGIVTSSFTLEGGYCAYPWGGATRNNQRRCLVPHYSTISQSLKIRTSLKFIYCYWMVTCAHYGIVFSSVWCPAFHQSYMVFLWINCFYQIRDTHLRSVSSFAEWGLYGILMVQIVWLWCYKVSYKVCVIIDRYS